MHILVTNDDGPPSAESSPYVLPFVRTLESAGHTVSVILPDSQRSWIGKAHMVGQDVQATHYWPPAETPETHSPSSSAPDDGKTPWVLVNSTPASCAQLGLSRFFFQERGEVDLVISGPNYGRNTTAVFALSSGTLGAALEASVCGHRAIALSFAFFDRRNLPDVVAESCQQALRVCSWLSANAAWGDGRLYTVNVPLLKGCTEAKTVWTQMLQNEWKQGACFQELPAASAVDDAATEEAKLRKQETRNESGTSTPAAESSKWPRRHFKWAPRFTDVYEAVQSAGPGSDGWAVKEGQTSISAIRANFMHTEPPTSTLPVTRFMAGLDRPAAAQAQPKRPSERSIAFAVSIVLSKPEGLDIKEYIRLLQQHIAPGSRERALSSVHRHLDRSSWWRGEYERTKEALTAAQEQTADLQREVEVLKGKLETARLSKPTKKRKKIDEDVVPVPRDPKRAKREATPPRNPQNPYVEVESDFAFSKIGEIGNVLLRNLYQIHAAMKSHLKNDPNILAYHLIRTASTLPQVVIQTFSECLKRPDARQDLLKSNLRAAHKAVVSLMSGLSRLSNAADAAGVQGRVIYAYVRMFSNLIEALGEASSREINNPLTGSEERPSTSKGKKKSEHAKPTNLKDDPSLNAFTSFLCKILDLLDPKVGVHGSLFEGFAHAVLNKLGSRLYTLVFGHARASTLEAEIARANEPDEIEDPPQESQLHRDEPELQQAKLEAPYLIHLLGRLMNAAPAHLGAIISTKTGKPKQANNKGSMKGALVLAAKDRLQRTLINCMFGTEGVDAQSPLMDCLKMPMAPSAPLHMPKVKETEVQEWFKEEVWRLLGWEVLSKEGDWEVI
ncbi:sure-like protein [Hortaea werneckii]|nr:sure-like protein [Hortaea werneckii]KAI6986222.1 sure-like protein [Hortaea werneckii]KAI7140623.1 sure-like protein [Hortaea werneckii]KAI7167365.1 sure-like protein [Hortaea werneckii]KAI7510859.1 sure-like protein [Hortaea werneckii]